MANKPISLIMLKEILRLKLKGLSNKQISKNLSLSRTTIVKYVKAMEDSGLSFKELNNLSEKDLHDLFSFTPSSTVGSDYEILLEKFPVYEKELQKTGVSRQLLWEEYRQSYPEGLSYSQFCYHFQHWRSAQQVYLHIEHKAGEKMFVDYTGKLLEYIDKDTGEIIKVEVFVAILGASQMTYVEASPSQKSTNFIRSVENSLWFFGGVSQAIVPDNLKAAVNRSSKYEPTLNERFADFGKWYDTTILPTRSYKPKDKALVEGAVKIIYHRIYAKLRHQVFYSLTALNQAIHALLKEYNDTLFQGKDYSRKALFIQTEKATLAPLPVERYPSRSYYKAKGQKNSHVLLSPDKHYYSIPFKHVGEELRIVYDVKNVEIYDASHCRIAVHIREQKPFGYTSIKEHLPSTHQFVLEWSSEKFITWARKIGEDTQKLITTILELKAYPEQGYKSCMGILSFAKKVGSIRLNNASRRAIHFQVYNYGVIKTILEKSLDSQPLDTPVNNHIPAHENLRGSKYYQ